MKLFGFLFVLFGWGGLLDGFNFPSLLILLAGLGILVGQEVMSHVLYVYKNEDLKIDRKRH